MAIIEYATKFFKVVAKVKPSQASILVACEKKDNLQCHWVLDRFYLPKNSPQSFCLNKSNKQRPPNARNGSIISHTLATNHPTNGIVPD
jgi:hypothetical protein